MEDSARGPDSLTLTAFVVAVFLGAGNFIGVRFSNRELEPLWGAGFRFAIATLIFVGVMAAMRLRPPKGRDLVATILFGALGFGAFYALMYWALVRVTAGFAAVVMAVVPLLTILAGALGVVGGLVISSVQFGITAHFYLQTIINIVTVGDFLSGVSKSFVFGWIIAMVGCFAALQTEGGTVGVGRATTRSVVLASIGVLVANFFLIQILVML